MRSRRASRRRTGRRLFDATERCGESAAGASPSCRSPGLVGEEAELVLRASGWSLTVDGQHRLAHVPALEAAGRAGGSVEAVVRASRLDEDLWEVETAAL